MMQIAFERCEPNPGRREQGIISGKSSSYISPGSRSRGSNQADDCCEEREKEDEKHPDAQSHDARLSLLRQAVGGDRC